MTETTMTGEKCPLPHAQPCPHWCVECDHEPGPDGPVIHRGREFRVPVIAQHPTEMIVQAWHADGEPAVGGANPTGMERPTVYLRGEHISDIDLTPEQCHTLIATLTAVNADLRTANIG